MVDENIQDPQGNSDQTQDPSGQDGNSTKQEPNKQNSEENVDNLPERFKGKSASDIAKDYLELQKKFGEHTQNVSKTRAKLAQWEKLGEVLESDPELYKQVEAKINKLRGTESESTRTSDKDEKQDDVRLERQGSIIGEFEKEFGINRLSAEKKEALHGKIANELADMLDPGGKKTVKEVIGEIPLARLRGYLDKAYRLATSNDREEQARLAAFAEAKQNREASFGSIQSSSLGGKPGQLTEDQKKVAKKMGISEEAYLKQVKALENE